MTDSTTHLSPTEISRLCDGTHDDPFSVLGPKTIDGAVWVTAIDPGADRLEAVIGAKAHPLERIGSILFSGK